MVKIASVLACLVCTGYGRRVQTLPAQVQTHLQVNDGTHVNPSWSLAGLLTASIPALAFNPSSSPAGITALGPSKPLISRACLGSITSDVSINDELTPGAELSKLKKLCQLDEELVTTHALESEKRSRDPAPSRMRAAPVVSRAPRHLMMQEQAAVVALSPDRRNAISGIALIGALGTLWLTIEKLGALGDASVCGTEACSLVLTGPYSSVSGIPLALFGCVAYFTVAVLAQAPEKIVFAWGERRAALKSHQALVGVASAMAVFSGYLMALLAFVIKAACPVCIASAVLSATQAALVWWEIAPLQSLTTSLAQGAIAALASSLMAGTLFVQADPLTAVSKAPAYVREKLVSEDFQKEMADELADRQEFEQAFKEKRTPRILRESSKRALAVAKRMKKADATMYGAFWCSHCYDQKRTLGKEAMSMLSYLECDTDASINQNQLCEEKDIDAYPTWFINGKEYRGERSLEDLEDILDGKEEAYKREAKGVAKST